ncbi:MAG: hypothetical protein ACLSAH_05735 [Bilophila wadsworthia]
MLAVWRSRLMEKYRTLFIDSITVASRLFQRASPAKLSARRRESRIRGAYDLKEMIRWVTQLQYIRGRNVCP